MPTIRTAAAAGSDDDNPSNALQREINRMRAMHETLRVPAHSALEREISRARDLQRTLEGSPAYQTYASYVARAQEQFERLRPSTLLTDAVLARHSHPFANATQDFQSRYANLLPPLLGSQLLSELRHPSAFTAVTQLLSRELAAATVTRGFDRGDAAQSFLAYIERAAREIDSPIDAIDEAGVRVDGVTIPLDEINRHAAEVISALRASADADRGATFSAAVTTLVSSLPRKIAASVLAVLAFLLLAVVENEVQYYTGELLAPMRKVVLREIRSLLKLSVPEDERRSQCVVVANRYLLLRSLPRRSDSAIIARLKFGSIVRVISARKDWTKVQFVKDDALVEGWVYTRYLQPIR